jgi:hypothetical protein
MSSEPSGRSSGWFCGCLVKRHDHQDTDELLRVSLYETAVRFTPQIVPYLALPPGVMLMAGGAPTIFQHGEELPVRPGSYLALQYPRR